MKFLLAFLILLVPAINFLLGIPLQTIVLYLMGVWSCYLLVNLSAVDAHIKADYLQTGEGLWGSLIILITAVLAGKSMFPVFLILWLSIICIEILIRIAVDPKRITGLISGVLFQAAALVAALFILFQDIPEKYILLQQSVSGYGSSMETHYLVPVFTAIILGTITFFMIKMYPELRLFSQGREFFHISEYNHRPFAAGLVGVRGLLASLTVFFLGWFGGTALYILSLFRSHFIALSVLIISSQIFVLLNHFFTGALPAGASYIISYIFYYFYTKTRRNIYD